jgi:endonuclease/exonuclease/phosphatase family metal-dependent hydrolase
MRSLLLAVLAALMVSESAPAQELRVMTFNIRYGTAADGADAWPLRKSALIDHLRSAAPDLLSLQEALRAQIDDIRGGLCRGGPCGRPE